jgi:hypothetical protein
MAAAGLFLLDDVEKSHVNAGMSERRRKICPALAFFLAVNFFSPSSAFRYQGQSGTASHDCPAMPLIRSITRVASFQEKNNSAEHGTDGNFGLFCRNSVCFAEQKTLRIPF